MLQTREGVQEMFKPGAPSGGGSSVSDLVQCPGAPDVRSRPVEQEPDSRQQAVGEQPDVKGNCTWYGSANLSRKPWEVHLAPNKSNH